MRGFWYRGVMCVSAGVVFYQRDTNGTVHVLMQQRILRGRAVLEDFGGKWEPCDQSVVDIAAREAAEESNAVIGGPDLVSSRVYIRELIEKNNTCIVHARSGYVLFIAELPGTYTSPRFGSWEHTTRLQRTVSWLALSDACSDHTRLHPRIRHAAHILPHIISRARHIRPLAIR